MFGKGVEEKGTIPKGEKLGSGVTEHGWTNVFVGNEEGCSHQARHPHPPKKKKRKVKNTERISHKVTPAPASPAG